MEKCPECDNLEMLYYNWHWYCPKCGWNRNGDKKNV